MPGFGPAVVSLPTAPGRFPVVLVAHGAGDKPEWQCEWWSRVLGARAVIACLRGSAMYPRRPDSGFYFRNHYALERELLALLPALRSAHGDQVREGPALFVGFSQGAIMGALVIPAHPELFSGAILIEGGYDEWNVAAARKLAKRPGVRVLLACGQSYCRDRARGAMHWLRRGGIAARLAFAPRAGHTYAGEVGERVRADLEWVIAEDGRWQSAAPVPTGE